eukprot:15432223-Alexandrium_andersonii.AAC.1
MRRTRSGASRRSPLLQRLSASDRRRPVLSTARIRRLRGPSRSELPGALGASAAPARVAKGAPARRRGR